MTEELFDLSDKYEAMLQEGLRLTGESPAFFAQGRLKDLRSRLPSGWTPRRILDFGCGVGTTTSALAALYPSADVVGLDTAVKALERARKEVASNRVSFGSIDTLNQVPPFNLCYINGVFHHIEPARRLDVLKTLYQATTPGGYLALFENNPWNPGTRLVMHRIPFDRDAVPLSSRLARRLIQEAGFSRPPAVRYLFYFPRWLSFLRFTESGLAGFPLGAQYYVLVQK